MRFVIYHAKHVWLALFLICSVGITNTKAASQCGPGSIFSDDYSNAANWTVLGTTAIAAPNCGGVWPGIIQINTINDNLEYISYRSRQTRRLARNLGGALNGTQNQFRIEFDFTLTSTNTDIGAMLLAVTQNNNHPHTNTSGQNIETNNNTIEIRLANPLGTQTGYRLNLTSKLGAVRGGNSGFININPNIHYWVRLQRVSAGLATLHIYLDPARTVLLGEVCLQINPGINGLDWIQHGGLPTGGCLRVTNLTLDNLCIYSTLAAQVCNVCSLSISANVSVQKAGCSGACNGSITVSGVTGGIAPYTYRVDGILLPGPTFTNICPGLHTLVIEDASGCRTQYDPQIAVESGCWQQTTFNSSSVDHGNDIENDQDGNIYVVGDYMGFTHFECNSYGVPTATNPVSGNGDKGMYLTKYGPCGEVLWTAYSESNTLGQWANATAIELDEANQVIYVTGEFRGANIIIRGGDGTSIQPPMNGYSDNMYIAKFDMNTGQVYWMLDYMDPTSGNYIPRGICHNGTDVYVGGQIDIGGFWLSFVMKTSVTGTPSVTYVTTLPDKDCFVEDIEIQSTGDVVVAGRYIGQIGMGLSGVSIYPITSGSNGTLYDGFVSGLSDGGSLAIQNWIYTTMANTGDGELYDLSIDDNDNIFVVGTVRGSTVNSFVHTGTSVSLPANNTTRSAIIARLNSSGTWSGSSWMNYSEPTSSEAKGKGIDVENGIVVVNGNHINSVPFEFYSAGPNTLNGPTIAVNNNNTVWVAQMYDLGGILDLNVTEGNGIQNAEAITNGEIFCHSTGEYNNDLVIAPNTYNGGVFANTKAFTIRNLRVLPDIPFMKPAKPVALTNTTVTEEYIKIYPNPASSKLFIESAKEDMELAIYNMMGQKMEDISIKAGTLYTLDISGLTPGVYMLKVPNSSVAIRFSKY